MVITMELKNVIKRNGIYHFRIVVPEACRAKVGKTEITQSLKTSDPIEMAKEVHRLSRHWHAEFKKAREVQQTVSAVDVKNSMPKADDLEQTIAAVWERNLREILDKEDDAALLERVEYYEGAIAFIQNRQSIIQFDFDEIGIKWPLKASSPGEDRKQRKILCKFLSKMMADITQELEITPAEHAAEDSKQKPVEPSTAPATASSEDNSLSEITRLMLASKKRDAKTETTTQADIRILEEWSGKSDITAYTKRDLIDFVQNCLPYVPSNMSKGNKYSGKSLRECIELTKADPTKYPPISHRTCGNRLINLNVVFNYAKDQMNLIPVNPAANIRVPEYRVIEKRPKTYTKDELQELWTALQPVQQEVDQHPARYWTTVLALYHGFRLNEICSLFPDDIYEDEDGIFVIYIRANRPTKKVKNNSSVRIVPVHPYVRDALGFKAWWEEQREERTNQPLFSDVTYDDKKGYRARMSRWFNRWKKDWLPESSHYKDFHGLRHTWSQQAQNQAKIDDCYAQEIMGHEVEGVSAVHRGYAGQSTPALLLEQLQRLEYGREH
ncbi:MAG: site-specific integrase [Kiritimatiellales bacterium]